MTLDSVVNRNIHPPQADDVELLVDHLALPRDSTIESGFHKSSLCTQSPAFPHA
jgi:hypothetical protein